MSSMHQAPQGVTLVRVNDPYQTTQDFATSDNGLSETTSTVSSRSTEIYIPRNLAHAALAGQCSLLQFPPLPPSTTEDLSVEPLGLPTLFLGHLRFETTPSEIRWLIHRTTGIVIRRCESRQNGCCVIHLNIQEDADRVRALHKRLLFDHGAVWFAHNEEAAKSLGHYLAHSLLPMQRAGQRLRLPLDAMVVETQKSTRGNRTAYRIATSHTSQQPAAQCGLGYPNSPSNYAAAHGGYSALPPGYAATAAGAFASVSHGVPPPPPYHAPPAYQSVLDNFESNGLVY